MFDDHCEDSLDNYVIHGSGLHGEETSDPTSVNALGYVVEDRVLMAALDKVVEGECQGVELVRGNRLKELKHETAEVCILVC